MRRGVLELPDETTQNANAMRRVVSDQIAALRDLSAIVERSGKMLDSSRPVASQPYQLQSAQTQAVVTEPTRQVAQNQIVQRGVQPQADFAPQQTTQRAALQTQPTPPKETGGESSGGWVSDLLRRASSNNEPAPAASDPRAPHHVVDSLNSLSMDIANAIDHEASVELWDRYQRGETNVFTRRLYTLQGQQTFDEIHSKYSADAEFKTAVDRYIDDFERLLRASSQKDTSGKMAQEYLKSDTGKVYTMLAHASGRLR